MKRFVVLVGLVGCGGSAEPEEVVTGCELAADGAAFDPPGNHTLEDVRLDGRWFVEDPAPGEAWSLWLQRSGGGVIVDHDDTSTYDGTAIATLATFTVRDTRYVVTGRIENYRSDDTMRYQTITCAGGSCQRCTSKLIRATRFHAEPVAAQLERLGELGGGATWAPGYTLNVRVAGTIAYLIRRDGLHVIETADPAHPTELGFYTRPTSGARNDVKIVDAGARRYAVIADTPLDVVDVTDPRAPVLAAQIPESAHTLFTETRDGKTLAYLGSLDGTCPVYDVTDPTVPVKLGQFDAGASYVHDLSVDGGIAYLNAWEKGFLVVDFRTPAAPRQLGAWTMTPGGASHSNWTTTAGGRHIAIHGDEGYNAHLDVVDVDPASPAFMTSIASWQTRPFVSIHNLMAFGTKAYFTHYQDGVRVLDLSDPLHPAELGHFDTWDPQSPDSTSAVFEGAVGLDVDLARKLVFVADSPRGLIILADHTP